MALTREALRKALRSFRKRLFVESPPHTPPTQIGQDSYRSPAPGSSAEATTPVRYPEDVFFTKRYNYDKREKTPFPGESIEDTKLRAVGYFTGPRHVPSPAFDEMEEKAAIDYYKATGCVMSGYFPRKFNGPEHAVWVSDFGDPAMFSQNDYPYKP